MQASCDDKPRVKIWRHNKAVRNGMQNGYEFPASEPWSWSPRDASRGIVLSSSFVKIGIIIFWFYYFCDMAADMGNPEWAHRRSIRAGPGTCRVYPNAANLSLRESCHG
ncbi:hypothetical protein KC19_6G121000 [Ceratodon purpureus]|uniref:Uncharacterized protein n=1 Tax=Ceratodon purpureus TaxID=3225 RepID=A0A8T0HFX1_CERPU|nr:hypothetical protein KC19_6G121000 [Ceratodon purpureus]